MRPDPERGEDRDHLDGSGYRRGTRTEPSAAARVLAAADTYETKLEPRPHRPALSGDEAAEHLDALAQAGRLDPEAVHAVLTAARHSLRERPRAWSAAMTDREVEILRLICRGQTKKQVADQLTTSVCTVDHHVRHIYEKAGVQTRAGATLFAVEHDLLG